MDAFELLKADHKKVSGLFDEIEAATDESKKNLFPQLKNELDIHAHIEEVIFYPALENAKEAREITLEAYEEHRVVKDLLAELESATPDEEWSAKLKVLRENIDHHVEEEEGELFNKAEDALGDEEIERLGDEMAAEKARKQGGAQIATERAARKAPAKTRSDSSKTKKKPGLLGALANLVGLGPKEESRTTTKRSAKSTSKKADKKAPAKKAAKKHTAKKTAAKRAAKKSSSKKASVRSRSTAQKANRSAGAKRTSKKTTNKSNQSRTSKSGGTKKRAGKR